MNRLHFEFTYYSTLRTREQIQVTPFFTLDPGDAYRHEYFWGFTPMEEVEDQIGRELYAKAQSATNQWALRFRSADAALDPGSYASLEQKLKAIASLDFSVYEVSIRNIVPETPKVLPPPPPKPSRVEEFKEEVMGSVATVRAMSTIEAEIRSSDPNLADDPFLGFGSHDGLLRRKIDAIKGELLK
jgi:hypothetical protein